MCLPDVLQEQASGMHTRVCAQLASLVLAQLPEGGDACAAAVRGARHGAAQSREGAGAGGAGAAPAHLADRRSAESRQPGCTDVKLLVTDPVRSPT